GSRALYATDASNYRQVPIGVVVPRTVDDVVTTIALCREHDVPVLARGGGTSLAGQCCNVAVVLDFSKYLNAILALDPEARTARIQPGVVLDELRAAAERHHLTFAPDPSTHNHCTLGGMIGNNSCGVHSVMGGKTDDNVDALEILTYSGERMRVGAGEQQRGAVFTALREFRDQYADRIRARFPRIPRRVSGYNLDQLLPENGFHVARALVGSEGTCVTVLEATVRLVPSPPARTLVVLGYPDVYAAADHVTDVLVAKPIGLEGIDQLLVDDMGKKGLHPGSTRLLPEGHGWLLVEFGGANRREADDRATQLVADLKRRGDGPSSKIYDDPDEERTVWRIRESGLGASARVPGEADTWEGWEDSAVPPERLGDYLREFRALLRQHGYRGALYGHFGQGCVHTRINFDLVTRAGIERYRRFVTAAADLVVSYGGSLSGEHGDGQSRAELLPRMYGPELVQAFREFKAIWDPRGRMNPGKVVDPYRLDENLRLGTSYRPRHVTTVFRYPGDDQGSFARATLRCVGVGECRRHDGGGGTMCPSYMVTREEEHSTRGRARLLFEMLEGEVITDGWRSKAVKQALDLCLACKGCKGDCPVNVDMATYKAEFLSHYYARRVRPRSAYAFGLIPRWARLASRMPKLVNALTQMPGVSGLAKLLAGVAPLRQIPRFADHTFVAWFAAREPRERLSDGSNVMIWPDTFTNHFHPEIGEAAVRVLERAGYTVEVPRDWVCCGRPLYDYGMLSTAKRWLRHTLRVLRPALESGTPIIGLEPSCVAVFRDEMLGLFPEDPDAKRLAGQVVLLSEFVAGRTGALRSAPLRRNALVHGHCHHKAIMTMRDEVAVLRSLALDLTMPDSGCCGMAGAFGFEKAHYGVSMKCGERVLLPAVRAAPADTLIIADGFSCREQIAQATGRRALHLAEVLDLATGAPKAAQDEGVRRIHEKQSHQADRRAYVRARHGQRR
ncbi:MAG TPA: FAD-linked oxidase C-terminal domain-containing protein, partial [Myxococcales bacterium]|nr:FAD-linked oxidase C-terminal domain-containing protein [Myxococcales bacterium]